MFKKDNMLITSFVEFISQFKMGVNGGGDLLQAES